MALTSDPGVLALWQDPTPIGRNEFLCWIDDAEQTAIRARRIARTCVSLRKGETRPCCWAGCIHRTDKASSRWQQVGAHDPPC